MFAFGPFVVDVLARTVTKNGVPLRLTLKCVELLIAFVRNPGKDLTKQELLDAAWPDPQTSDATLAQHVFLLRRALRHNGTVWIRTIPNVGYRFVAEVCAFASRSDERACSVEAYLDGARVFRDIGTERALRSAIDLCGRAISLDDTCAVAHVLRANCWRLLAESMHAEPVPALQSARADALAALARDPAMNEARIEAALCGCLLEHDADRALEYLDDAQKAHPEHAGLARARLWVALIAGRRGEALEIGRRFDGFLHATALYITGDFERAAGLLEQYAEKSFAARLIRGACRLLLGDPAGALEDLRTIYYAEIEGGAGGAASVRQQALAFYILALAKNGEMQFARRRARTLDALAHARYVSPMARAVAQMAIGDRDGAIALIGEAIRRRDPWSAYVLVDPVLADLRDHPQFALVARRAA